MRDADFHCRVVLFTLTGVNLTGFTSYGPLASAEKVECGSKNFFRTPQTLDVHAFSVFYFTHVKWVKFTHDDNARKITRQYKPT